MGLSALDLEELRRAKRLLENPGWTARLTSVLGTPLERGFALLPERWSESVENLAARSLERALEVALGTLDGGRRGGSRDRLHKLLVAATGGVGGAFGLPALAVELPISTTVMLRSIADVARSQGEALHDPEAHLACLQVFALGGASNKDDASEAGYFVVRAGLARLVSEVAEQIAARGALETSSPALARLLARIAARFGGVVSEKLAAQALPVLGAAGGALVNTLFIDHFQDVARGHFTVRRLERVHGAEVVRAAFEALET